MLETLALVIIIGLIPVWWLAHRINRRLDRMIKEI